MKPFKKVSSRFNPDTPKLKQIFCRHEYEGKREDSGWFKCYYMRCKKCGKFKDLYYYDKRW